MSLPSNPFKHIGQALHKSHYTLLKVFNNFDWVSYSITQEAKYYIPSSSETEYRALATTWWEI